MDIVEIEMAGGDVRRSSLGALGGVGGGESQIGAGPSVAVAGDVDVGEPSDLSTVGDAGGGSPKGSTAR